MEYERPVYSGHYVQPDHEEHGGKTKWREHLKRTGAIEVGHTEMRERQEKWESRKSKFKDRFKNAERQNVRSAEVPDGEIRAWDRSRVNAEIANRLDGRPIPERKMLLKLTLETARQFER